MTKEIYFAGGCFWGTQHYFKQIRGVISSEAGYANGDTPSPSYEEVYTDRTGYAETVKVVYDPDVVGLGLLLELYFRSIDSTALNHQGGDFGTRYRTGIYYTAADDLPLIMEVYAHIERFVGEPLAVEVERLRCYYPAEEYHQDYLTKNPAGYCHIPRALMIMAREANEE